MCVLPALRTRRQHRKCRPASEPQSRSLLSCALNEPSKTLAWTPSARVSQYPPFYDGLLCRHTAGEPACEIPPIVSNRPAHMPSLKFTASFFTAFLACDSATASSNVHHWFLYALNHTKPFPRAFEARPEADRIRQPSGHRYSGRWPEYRTGRQTHRDLPEKGRDSERVILFHAERPRLAQRILSLRIEDRGL